MAMRSTLIAVLWLILLALNTVSAQEYCTAQEYYSASDVDGCTKECVKHKCSESSYCRELCKGSQQ